MRVASSSARTHLPDGLDSMLQREVVTHKKGLGSSVLGTWCLADPCRVPRLWENMLLILELHAAAWGGGRFSLLPLWLSRHILPFKVLCLPLL